MTPAQTSRLPRLLPGVDLRALPLSPAEAFVVSRVDGQTNIADIAAESGKSAEDVEALLERLAKLGAVSFEDAPRSQERRVSPAPRPNSGAFRIGPIVEASASASDVRHPAASLYDPAELDEPVDIDLPTRRRILDLFYRLEQLTHYQVFDVEPTADKKAIKAAYFDVVNVFHPDRYFGKNVGKFKPKLERVFSRLTEAYDVLSRNQNRVEYDAYLRAQSKTRAFDAGQTESATHQAALREVMRRIQAEASVETRGRSVAPPPLSPPPVINHAAPAPAPGVPAPHSPAFTPPPTSARTPAPGTGSNPSLRPSALRPSDPEIRKRALARKLGRSSGASGETDAGPLSRPGVGVAPQPSADSAEVDAQRKAWAADELKRRYQDRVQAAKSRQIEAYLRAAQQAVERSDLVGAANALRIAVSLAPEDTSLAERLNEVSGRAKQELATSYLEQAAYEERDEKWLAAATSYARALPGRPEAATYDKLAHCLLSGNGDLREAGEAAKKAVLLQPDNARFRVTLARFYAKAGMKQSAEGELSRAATLGPSDDKVADWIRRLKRELA